MASTVRLSDLTRAARVALAAGAAGLLLACASCATPASRHPGEAAADVGALDKFGLYRARRVVLAPIEVARLAPGDAHGEVAPVATLGRARDASSVLLLRFALDLPPEATVLEAHVVLDLAPEADPDPASITLHAARILDPWSARTLAWGRAPRVGDAHLPPSRASGATRVVRLDVGTLVRRWGRHAREDQGIAVVADSTTVTGMTFAMLDGSLVPAERPAVLPVRTLADTPPTFFAGAEASEGTGETEGPRGPRLELYVRP